MRRLTLVTITLIAVLNSLGVAQVFYCPITGNYYEKIEIDLTWEEAKTCCESFGGHLATITSQKENDWVWETFGGAGWLGGTDVEEEGVWEWITDETWDYENWRRGEPNNDGPDGNEDFLTWGDSRGWNDSSDTALKSHFICEYEVTGISAFSSEDRLAITWGAIKESVR